MIAAPSSTIRQVDRIYVIEDGAVTESGTHDELLAKEGGTYRRLAALQFGHADLLRVADTPKKSRRQPSNSLPSKSAEISMEMR